MLQFRRSRLGKSGIAMSIIKLILITTLTLFLGGCCCNNPPPTPLPTSLNPPADDAGVQLAEAASSISQSLTDLTALEKAASPPINCKCLPYPTSSDLCQLASIDWSGPIEPLLRRIACMTNYRLRVIGLRPAIPVLVTIFAKNTPIGYILRDANFQATSKASVQVYPGICTIELRYGRI